MEIRSSSTKPQITVDFIRQLSVPRAIGTILLISLASFLFLIYLIYFRGGQESEASWVQHLPSLNALLNSVSTVLIISGYIAVRRGNYLRHMKLMLSAFITSALFLISYLIYHNFTGHTPFPGEGLIRPVYFTILITHIVLSAFVIPLVLTSFYFAYAGKFTTHRKMSRWTFPIWLYVSVTGVVIYLILNAYV